MNMHNLYKQETINDFLLYFIEKARLNNLIEEIRSNEFEMRKKTKDAHTTITQIKKDNSSTFDAINKINADLNVAESIKNNLSHLLDSEREEHPLFSNYFLPLDYSAIADEYKKIFVKGKAFKGKSNINNIMDKALKSVFYNPSLFDRTEIPLVSKISWLKEHGDINLAGMTNFPEANGGSFFAHTYFDELCKNLNDDNLSYIEKVKQRIICDYIDNITYRINRLFNSSKGGIVEQINSNSILKEALKDKLEVALNSLNDMCRVQNKDIENVDDFTRKLEEYLEKIQDLDAVLEEQIKIIKAKSLIQEELAKSILDIINTLENDLSLSKDNIQVKVKERERRSKRLKETEKIISDEVIVFDGIGELDFKFFSNLKTNITIELLEDIVDGIIPEVIIEVFEYRKREAERIANLMHTEKVKQKQGKKERHEEARRLKEAQKREMKIVNTNYEPIMETPSEEEPSISSESKIKIVINDGIKEQMKNIKLFTDIDRQTFDDMIQDKGLITIGKVMGSKDIWRIKKPGKRLRLFGSLEGNSIVIDSVDIRNENTYRRSI